jgi:hypothetical protein
VSIGDGGRQQGDNVKISTQNGELHGDFCESDRFIVEGGRGAWIMR